MQVIQSQAMTTQCVHCRLAFLLELVEMGWRVGVQGRWTAVRLAGGPGADGTWCWRDWGMTSKTSIRPNASFITRLPLWNVGRLKTLLHYFNINLCVLHWWLGVQKLMLLSEFEKKMRWHSLSEMCPQSRLTCGHLPFSLLIFPSPA